MIRYLPLVVELALLVYCLIECIQADSASVRNLSKTWWIILIILVPIVGPVAWLVAGRPTSAQRRRDVPWPSTQTAGFPEYERPRAPRAPRGPDDDAAFLAAVDGPDSPDPEKEWLLAQWENQLREREAKLRGDDGGAEPGESDGAAESETEPRR